MAATFTKIIESKPASMSYNIAMSTASKSSSFSEALHGRQELTITIRGRRSGHPIILPVWFVHNGSDVLLLPVHGSKSQWFLNLQANATITLNAGRQRLTGTAHLFVDQAKAMAARKLFEQKYGASEVAKYYSVFDAVVEVPLAS